MKPKTNRQRKERESDKDTVVAYHEFLQGRIQGELNGVTIGPGYTLSRIAIALYVFGFVFMILGILVISLRHRHVYLVSWDDQFLGPFFIIMFLLCCTTATFLLLIAKRRTNQYRKDLAFRPIGDYGVAVVHKSKLTYEEQKKSELKSGTTPRNVRHPGKPNGKSSRSGKGPNDRGNRGDYSKSRGYDGRGYNNDTDNERRRDRDRERGRDDRDGRSRDDRPRGDRPPRDRPPRDRGDDDRERRRRDDPDRERGRRDPGRPRPPMTPEEEEKRREARRRYEEDKRRRYEEDKRRAELRKQAEAENESYDRLERSASQERGIDLDPSETRTFKVQTTVKLSRELQDADESAI